MAQIDDLKTLLGISGNTQDALLGLILSRTQAEALAYTSLETLPDELEDTTTAMAVIEYRRMGSEGLASQSYSGSTEQYTDTWPTHILRTLNRFRRVRII